jgi:branched-chain amino acid transport system substrate-binding protein
MAEPLCIGVLVDTASGPSDNGSGVERMLRLAVDSVRADGRLDRDVEYVQAYGLGLPNGTAVAIERAYAELEAQGVLAIVGPAIGDNALVATPLADRYEVPTINWAGTERARSDWMFHLQVGSHEDEPILLARHLVSMGAHRVGVVYDRSPIGRRYFAFFQEECEVLGVQVVTAMSVAPMVEDAAREGQALKEASIDAIVYLGLGLAVPAVVAAISGIDVPRLMNTAGLRGYSPEFGRQIDGWIYIDMVDDGNQVLAALGRRLGDDRRGGFGEAMGFDLGQLLAEGLARATELTRGGVREGLEKVKWIPAAEGEDGTMLSFGHYDRGALHGRYMVLRQWQDGVSVQL